MISLKYVRDLLPMLLSIAFLMWDETVRVRVASRSSASLCRVMAEAVQSAVTAITPKARG